MRKILWREFIIDCGDTVGGIGVGISFNNNEKNLPLLIISVTFILLATLLKINKYKIEK